MCAKRIRAVRLDDGTLVVPEAVPRVIANTVDLHYRYQFDNQACENVFQFAYVPGHVPTAVELLNLANEFSIAYSPLFRSLVCPAVTLREIYVRDIHAATGRAQATLSLNGVAGTHGGESEPGNTAVNMILRSGLTGRSQHGAKRLGPLPETDVTSNEFGSALLTILLNIAAQWLLRRVSNTYIPAIGSLKFHTSSGLGAVAVNNSNVDSQKTRLAHHGI